MQSTIINRVATQQERLSLFRPGLFKIKEYRGRGGGVALIHCSQRQHRQFFAGKFRRQFLIGKPGLGPKPLIFVSPKVEQINLRKSYKNSDLKQKLISPHPRYE